MALIPFDTTFLEYLINAFRNFESGDLGGYADPLVPTDFNTPLTQAEINFLKSFIKEVKERFVSSAE